MKKIKIKIILVLMGGFLSQQSYCQTLNEYIIEGLTRNEVLQQRDFMLSKSFSALKQAKGLFYPSLTFQSDYNYAQGGRSIDIPLGDILNPVYTSLNDLIHSSKFPQLANQSITLAPNDYTDTRLIASMQIFNAEIIYNYKIKKEATSEQMAEVNVYKRELVKNIKEAYFNILLTVKQKAVFENAAALLNENLKLTGDLVKSGKSLRGDLLRVQSDINTNKARIIEAENNYTVACAYFNFLLNKGADDEVNIDTSYYGHTDSVKYAADINQVLSRREELQVLKSGISQADFAIKMTKAFYIPSLSTYSNIGYQGTAFKFTAQQQYINGGVSLRWNIFNGFQNKSRVSQARLDAQILDSQLSDAEKQLNLQFISATKSVNTAEAQLNSAAANLQETMEFYREMKNRYQQGLVLLVTLTDASTQYINSLVNFQIAKTNLLIKNADLERVSASYSL